MNRVWFHLIASTYGSWLPGDPCGFRTWRHKEHVKGDYRQRPPADLYLHRHAYARHLQTADTVFLLREFLGVVGLAFREQLTADGGRVLAIAISRQHVHLQVQLDDGDAREPVGRAKLHAYFALRDRGWTGRLWGKRCKVVRIQNREHQENVYRYILDHVREGAWVWNELKEVITEGT